MFCLQNWSYRHFLWNTGGLAIPTAILQCIHRHFLSTLLVQQYNCSFMQLSNLNEKDWKQSRQCFFLTFICPGLVNTADSCSRLKQVEADVVFCCYSPTQGFAVLCVSDVSIFTTVVKNCNFIELPTPSCQLKPARPISFNLFV